MKIGLYLAYGPNVVLTKEGLGRYLGSLLKGFTEDNHDVSVACPEWMLDSLDELAEEFNLDKSKLNFIASYKTPAFLSILEWLKKERDKKSKSFFQKWNLRRKLCGTAWSIMSLLTSVSSMALFIPLAVLLGVMFVLLSPLFLIGGIILLLRAILKKGTNKINLKSILRNMKARILRPELLSRVYQQMLKNAEKDLTKQINGKYGDKVDIWYCPSAFWSGFGDVKGVTVLNVPDLVTSEFTFRYAEQNNFAAANKRVKNSIQKGKYFITYCDYLKKSLLEERFNVNSENIVSIPHAANQLDRNITFDSQLAEKFGVEQDYSTVYSRSLLNGLYLRNKGTERYVKKFNFQNVQYIFYSSQIRPHKNVMTLVKAYEYLLRRKYVNVKLVLTGDITANVDLWDYIQKHRLQYDVLCFFNIPEKELAALYRCADLVVNPTLYEGGFPFTFTEGMSVGTPSIMSDIPQVRDVVEQYGLEEEMLFDPYDWKALADKMADSLTHRNELYQMELPMYQKMAERTSKIVAQEYVRAFEYFIELEKKSRK